MVLATMFTVVAACGDDTGGTPPPGSSCPALGAPVTHSGFLTADETWSGDRPHVVTSDLTVSKGVTLTIEPCAEVRLKKSVYFYVQGRLHARGEETRRIRFVRDVESERFSSIVVQAPGSAELAHADLEGGGAPANSTRGATLAVDGYNWPPDRPLKVEHVTVRHSAGVGVHLRKWAGFAPGSSDLTVQSSGEEDAENPFALRLSLNAVSTIPAGSYTGNAQDAIQLIGESPHYNVELDETIPNRGVPYQVGGGGMFGVLGIQGASTPTLTIEPGVTVRFWSSASSVGGLQVGNTGTNGAGRLVAVGTASAPIRFEGTGLGSGPGSWEGVTFWGTIDAGNKLEHLQIDGAGAHGGDTGFGCPPAGSATDGAVKLFSVPPTQFIKSVTISNSSSHGVYMAWNGDPLDYLAGNTYSSVAGCNQIIPKPKTGSCPTTPPCPK
jgi:hypothetical protein